MKKFFVISLTLALFAPFIPVQAGIGDTTISRPEPQEAVVNTPTLFWVTAEDPDGVTGCTLVVSSIHDTPMTYNASLSRWEATYTFSEIRTANSIRARCVDGIEDEVLGSPRVIPVLEIDLTSNDGELPDEVDATEYTSGQVVAESPVLVKTPCPGGEDFTHPCRTVFFLDNVGVRHAFPNEKVYFTWYTEFKNIHVITGGMMGSFALGHNVRYHPGTKLVKFPSINTVYAVAGRGILRAVDGEDIAAVLYGDDWNQQVDDISEAFFSNYSFGEAINDIFVFAPTIERGSVDSINDNLNL